jgi:hypothetical protein
MNEFGRQIQLERRFDDFAKLHENLSSVAGLSLPPLPPKAFFGGNDPKVIEERRPALERILRECLSNDKVLTEEHGYLCKFLEIPDGGVNVIRLLFPETRTEALPKLIELLRPDASDNYRLFHKSVIEVLISCLHSTDISSVITALDILQFILSRAHLHPLAKSVDVQQIFVDLGGFRSVWSLLKINRDIRENCRRVLSSLITSNSLHIEKYENLILGFLTKQKGLSLLVDSVADDGLHEVTAKILWFGLSASVQQSIAQHPNGLSLLGRLFSSPDVNARCLSGLTLSVLLASGSLDQTKASRAIEGVESILQSLVTATGDNVPSPSFLSSLCRGSSNGLKSILFCVDHGTYPMADLCSYVLLNADLPSPLIESANISSTMESALMRNPTDSIIAMNCARFLFRQYESEGKMPNPRADGKISDLIQKVRLGLVEYARSSRQLISSEQKQYAEFQRTTLTSQLNRINSKQVESIDFTSFEEIVKQYVANRENLSSNVKQVEEMINLLGQSVKPGDSSDQWMSVNSEILKEWNQSMLALEVVHSRLNELKDLLSEKEQEAQSASADSENLQNVITKMREEIVAVDSRAEEYRRESSRFSSAANGAVDPELMLSRANESELKAKEEIIKREALRQSQDSLENQLEGARRVLVRAETDATGIRKSIAETTANLTVAEQQHRELESRMKLELYKATCQWKNKLSLNQDQLELVGTIVRTFNKVNDMIGTENEQKDLLVSVIGELVLKLQKLQMQLQ